MLSANKIYKVVIYILVSIIFLSCKEDIEFIPNQTNEKISWVVDIDDSKQTRGQPINSSTDILFKSFGLYSYSSNTIFNPYNTTTYIDNAEVIKKTGTTNTWELTPPRFWPQNDSLSFFAYFPYINGINNYGLTIINNPKGIPSIQYSMPSEVSSQPDLMIATGQNNTYKETVPLTFNHALSCLGFNIQSPKDYEIEYIAIVGISTQGTISLNYTGGEMFWDNLSGINDSIFYVGIKSNSFATDPPQDLMEVDGYLMVIPQSLDINSRLVIKYVEQDKPLTITLKTNNTPAWKPGYRYMYYINDSGDAFSVTVNNNSITYLGGIYTFSISSQSSTGSTTETLGWDAQIIYPAGNTDNWLLGDISDNTGGLDIIKQLGVLPLTGTPEDITDQTLRNTPPVSDLNLSMTSSGSYTTANCYVINAPGTYKFLCNVMGNGFNGASGTSKNNLNGWNSYGYGRFKDYKGNSINQLGDIYIETSGAKAKLIWQDVYGLITDLSLNGDYISFNVPQKAISQGNAIIAIVDSDNQVMWSWHIWVTTYKLGDNQYINPANIFMARNIGSCLQGVMNYQTRTAQVKFTQHSTGKVIIVDLTQYGGVISTKENNVSYQWGRKDPIVGTTGQLVSGSTTSYELKETFGLRPFKVTDAGSGVPLNYGIINPNIFYSSQNSSLDYRWCSDAPVTLWGEMKTIYDPSPIGYKVPPYYAMSNFCYTNPGQGVNNEWSSPGLMSSMQSNPSNSIFLYAGGKIDNTGTYVDYTTKGYYWAPQDYSNYFYCLSFMQYESGSGASVYCGNNVSINGVYGYQQSLTNGVAPASSGFAIRPVVGN